MHNGQCWSRWWNNVVQRARRRRKICVGPSRPFSGGMRTAPSGALCRLNWARLGVWERLLNLVQERGIQLGMTFLDGTSVRAHQKAAGARRKGALKLNETIVKHLADLVGDMAPRLA